MLNFSITQLEKKQEKQNKTKTNKQTKHFELGTGIISTFHDDWWGELRDKIFPYHAQVRIILQTSYDKGRLLCVNCCCSFLFTRNLSLWTVQTKKTLNQTTLALTSQLCQPSLVSLPPYACCLLSLPLQRSTVRRNNVATSLSAWTKAIRKRILEKATPFTWKLKHD